jgi:hypothetical protein
MEHKLLEPIELADAELDVVSGGSFVGIKQSNRGGNVITRSGGSGAATAFSFTNTNTQSNSNTGAATNFGAVSG